MLNGIRKQSFWEPVCFFLISVGYTMGWTTLSSMLASFKDDFGPAVLLQLNLAYFLPSIPVLFLQTQYDSVLDRKIGLPRAMAARMIIGLGGAGVLCVFFPFVSSSLTTLLVVTTLLGLCCGVAFASSYQLVSRFGVECSKALTIGFVGSGPVVLLLELLDGIGPSPAESQQIFLYTTTAVASFIGLAASLILLAWNWENLLFVGRGKRWERLRPDSESQPNRIESFSADSRVAIGAQGLAIQRAIVQHQRSSEESEVESQTESDKSSVTTWSQESQPNDGNLYALAVEIWPAAAALAVSAGCATLLFPFFTFVSSSGLLKTLLPQVMFFVRTVSDILGRFIPHSWLPKSRQGLHAMTIIKLAATPLAFWYIMAKPFLNDALAIVYIALFWLQSGAVNSVSFVLADKWSSSALQGKAGGFLAFTFQSSCLVALGIAFLMQKFCAPFKSQWS